MDEGFESRFPTLYEFLACGVWEGEARKGGSITVFISQGQLKACFLDKQTQMAFYSVLNPGGDLWAVLEDTLAGQHEPWQPTKHGKGGVPGF